MAARLFAMLPRVIGHDDKAAWGGAVDRALEAFCRHWGRRESILSGEEDVTIGLVDMLVGRTAVLLSARMEDTVAKTGVWLDKTWRCLLDGSINMQENSSTPLDKCWLTLIPQLSTQDLSAVISRLANTIATPTPNQHPPLKALAALEGLSCLLRSRGNIIKALGPPEVPAGLARGIMGSLQLARELLMGRHELEEDSGRTAAGVLACVRGVQCAVNFMAATRRRSSHISEGVGSTVTPADRLCASLLLTAADIASNAAMHRLPTRGPFDISEVAGVECRLLPNVGYYALYVLLTPSPHIRLSAAEHRRADSLWVKKIAVVQTIMTRLLRAVFMMSDATSALSLAQDVCRLWALFVLPERLSSTRHYLTAFVGEFVDQKRQFTTLTGSMASELSEGDATAFASWSRVIAVLSAGLAPIFEACSDHAKQSLYAGLLHEGNRGVFQEVYGAFTKQHNYKGKV